MEMEGVLSPALQSKTIVPDGDAFRVGGVLLTPLVTGVGLVNASRRAGAALAKGGVDGVIAAGVAGSYDLDKLPMGSAAAACEEVWPEYGLEDGPGADPQALGFPLAEISGKPIWSRIPLAPTASAKAMGLNAPSGLAEAPCLSVSTVSATREKAAFLQKKHGALLENMEGFAWALACLEARTPFLELRGVSNLAGSRLKRHWRFEDGAAAAGRLLEKVLRFACKGGYDQEKREA
jgi:futalosine hydrolase